MYYYYHFYHFPTESHIIKRLSVDDYAAPTCCKLENTHGLLTEGLSEQ